MKARFILPLALLLLCAGAALAQTPDGVPPSLETVCDLEQGAAYGLCTAYCEAMDCESDNPSASATACEKVGGKFLQITGRNLPCEVSCPCAGAGGTFANFLAGAYTVEACVRLPLGILILRDIEQPNDYLAGALSFGESAACFYVGDGTGLPISPEQAQYCADLLEQEANRRGLTCTAQ